MNCAEGRLLIGRLRADARLEDSQRRALLQHFAGCAACRREGLALDPLNLFLGAAALEPERSEIEVIRQTVTSMRRFRELEDRRSRAGRRARWTAAAGILLAAVFLTPSSKQDSPAPGRPQASSAPLPVAQRPAARELVRVSAWEDSSIVENLDRPEARVYQLTEQDLFVVMIVDESLDL